MPPSSGSVTGRPPRVAFYSHDALGLGHVRRNLAVAAAFSALPGPPQQLLVTGTPEAGLLPRPAGCDVVVLPALSKDRSGDYRPRYLGGGLGQVTRLRASMIAAALREFAPDVLVVDKHPRGLHAELEPALDEVRATGQTRVVLGLRDVLDTPEVAALEWRREGGRAALHRWYDEVWIYGDPTVFDAAASLDVPAGVPVHHTGYLARHAALGRQPHVRPGPSRVLGLVGGGKDGQALAAAFARMTLPAGRRADLVLGPQMPEPHRRAVHATAARRPDLTVHDFVRDTTELLDGAGAVVSMGGYNSVCEVLARGVPSLIVPRTTPRREQWIRADALRRRHLVDVLEPDRLAPAALGAWVAAAVRPSAAGRDARVAGRVDLDGLLRLPGLLLDLLERAPRPVPAARPASHPVDELPELRRAVG